MATPSPERVAVDWLRTVTANVATDLPADPPLPFAVVTPVAGTTSGYIPSLGRWLINLDVYGTTKASADDLLRQIADAADTVHTGPGHTTTWGTLVDVTITSWRRIREPDLDWYRYQADLFCMIIDRT